MHFPFLSPSSLGDGGRRLSEFKKPDAVQDNTSKRMGSSVYLVLFSGT